MSRHVNPQAPNRKSKAPYNFVPLPEAVFLARTAEQDTPPWKRFDEYIPGAHTGWIDLTVKTETPLYIRGAQNEDTTSNPNFFHHGDPNHPVIPGSSIRGMIRNLVEILSFGKMQWFTDKRLIYRAVGDTSSLGQQYRDRMLGPNQKKLPKMLFEYPISQLRGGYLEKNGLDWAIRPAREFCGESFVHVDYSDCPWAGRHDQGSYGVGDILPVFVKPVGRTQPKRSNSNLTLNLACTNSVVANDVAQPAGYEKGALVRSGHMRTGKHMHCVVYEKDPKAPLIPIPRSMWKLYVDDRDLTRGIPTRKLEKAGDPLFYLADGNGELVFFGPTMMFRVPYIHRIKDFVPVTIRNPQDRDLAETLFGTVDTTPAIKGRVYFEDAKWNGSGGSPFLEGEERHLIPKILSTPKPTAFQHYLVQPIVKPPKGTDLNGADDRLTLHNWDQPEPGKYDFHNANGGCVATGTGSNIRGHKRYWHKPGTTPEQVKDGGARFNRNGQGVQSRNNGRWQQSTQHTIIRPVKKGTVFKGRVRFENLSDLELGALLSALQLPTSKRHHLGMGKPLGMGSVRIEAVLHITARTGKKSRYASLFANDGTFNLGELSAEQEEIGRATKQVFRKEMVRHYNNSATTDGNTADEDADLWDIPRLQVLALMLEWDQALSLDEKGYEPLGNGRAWRDRRVLPTPHGVIGSSEPVVPVAGKPPGLTTAQQASQPIPTPDEAALVRTRIQHLASKGNVSQMPEIVGQIARLSDETARGDCAQLLREWLKKGGKKSLWKDKKHADTEWRKQLDSLLG